MKPLVLAILLVLVQLSVVAQAFNERCLHNANTTQFYALQSRNDSLLVIGTGGWVDSPFTQKFSYSVYNDTGGLISTQMVIGDTGMDYFASTGTSLITTLDNKKATVGCMGYGSSNEGFLAMIDNADSIILFKTYTDTTAIFLALTNVVQLRDSSFMLIGAYQGSDYIVKAIVIRIDKFGNEIWSKYIGSGTDKQSPTCILQQRDGRIFLFVDREQNQNLPISTFWNKVITYELDTSGTILHTWIKSDSTFSPFDVIPVNDGFLVAIAKEIYYDSTDFVITQGYYAKLDTNFMPVWQQLIGRATGLTAFYTFIKLHDGNYLAVGTAYDSTVIPNQLVESGWLTKFNEQGDLLWQRKYITLDSNGATNLLNGVIELSDGSLVACGESNNPFVSVDGYQGWLLRLDSCGCLVPGCQTRAGMPDIRKDGVELKIYPNPSNSQCYVYFNALEESANYDLRILDMDGREINKMSHMENDVTYILNTSNYVAGAYIVSLFSNNVLIKSVEFVHQ